MLNYHHVNRWGKRLIITMVMNLIIPIVQIIGGILAGSVALISDAVHNLGDFTATLISYIALRIGEKPATSRLTFGYKRIEVLAAVVNVALLTTACVYIAYEGWKRFTSPQPIRGELVIVFALIGFIANMIAVVILHRGAKENLNLRSVFLHMLTDALTSIGVVFVGIIWVFAPLYWLDPVVSWIIVALILYGAWDILKNAFTILMDATPPGLDINDIQRAVLSIDGIDDVHHIHVWNMSPDRIALAAHIIVPDQMLSDVDSLAVEVREMLFSRFNIDHPILQFETDRYEDIQTLCHM
ncbi:MAG: cation transporter [Deltaproteobacteria bacterium]|nr:cation transporter [Deltaproteobacteria bacterium]